MAFNLENGFIPDSFDDLMNSFIIGVNRQFGTEYTSESFVGSNFYKYYYAIAQEVMAAQINFAEAYSKLQDYIRATNKKLTMFKTPTDWLIGVFKESGYDISVKPTELEDAGTLSVCVDVDKTLEDFAESKAEILNILKTYTAAGIYFYGDQLGTITASNGQQLPFAFFLAERLGIELRLTLKISKNTKVLVDSVPKIKEKLLKNLSDSYALGRDFEPDTYFTTATDAPYAAQVLLEWRKLGEDIYRQDIYNADFRELFTFKKEDIIVVVE